MPTPLVSVIIPFLNGGDWLRQAVESVINQSYQNWEIILVDDGSNPEVSAIARGYETSSGGKIIYTEHPGHVNKGVTASRNLGIKTCRGDMIALLDSDDCWLPEKLTNQLRILQAHPEASVLCEASRYWFSWDKASHQDIVIEVGGQQNKAYTAPQLMFELYPLGKGAAPCPSGMILKRGAMERCGGFEESFTGANQVYEDQAFLCKLYLRETIFISAEVNNLYRQRSGSLMQSIHKRKQYRKVRAYFLRWLRDYLQKERINNDRLDQLLGKAFFEVNQPLLFTIKKKLSRLFSWTSSI